MIFCSQGLFLSWKWGPDSTKSGKMGLQRPRTKLVLFLGKGPIGMSVFLGISASDFEIGSAVCFAG